MYIDGTTLVKLPAFWPHRHVWEKKKKKKGGILLSLISSFKSQMLEIRIQTTEKLCKR